MRLIGLDGCDGDFWVQFARESRVDLTFQFTVSEQQWQLRTLLRCERKQHSWKSTVVSPIGFFVVVRHAQELSVQVAELSREIV